MIGDADRLTKATHRYRCRKGRLGFGTDVAQQVDTAAILRSMMCTGHTIDQIFEAVGVPIDGAKRFGPVNATLYNCIVDRHAITESQNTILPQVKRGVFVSILDEQCCHSSVSVMRHQIG